MLLNTATFTGELTNTEQSVTFKGVLSPGVHMAQPTTPSLARGIQPVPRRPPLTFTPANTPVDWFDGDPGCSAAWNAISVLAEVGEAQFITTGRWLIDRIDCSVVAEETARFIQQEASHSAVHRRYNKALAAQGVPMQAAHDFAMRRFVDLQDRTSHSLIAAIALAGEQAIGELGHAVLARPEVMEGAEEVPRTLWMWHWYEEVEHQAALHDGWVHVHGHGRDGRHLRVLGVAFLAVYLATAWPVVTWVLRGQTSLRGWGRVLWQMFGRQGLLVGAARNLTAMLRADFHPFDMHDPVPTLAEWDGVAVKPEWERPTRKPKRHGGIDTTDLPSPGLSDWACLLGFSARSVVAGARLMWAHRRSYRLAWETKASA